MAARWEGLKPLVAKGVGHVSARVAVRGRGAYLETADGRRMLDFTAGIGVVNTGHCHPRVVAAIQAQASEMLHSQINCVWSPRYLELCEGLKGVMPDASLDRFILVNSGAEAIENAVKIARVATGRQIVVVFQGSFHGRTIGTMSMTTSKYIYRQHMGPLMPGVLVAPFPYCHRCECASKPSAGSSDCCMWPLEELRRLLKQSHHPSEIAACVIEPVLGEGGYVPAPPAFMQGLRKLCDEHGILLVLDEVQTGFGRTGEMFGAQLSGVRPDLLVMAKGLASGMPLSCVAGAREVVDRTVPGTLGGTYAGNPVACAAALATLQVFEQERLVDNARIMGAHMRDGLRALQRNLGPDVISDVRGPGLMIGVEFGRAVPAGFAARVVSKCEEEGVLVLTAGSHETLRIIPPLIVQRQDCDLGLELIGRGIKAAVAELPN